MTGSPSASQNSKNGDLRRNLFFATVSMTSAESLRTILNLQDRVGSFLAQLVIGVMAHRIHKTLSHETALGAVGIALDSNSVGFHLGDNEMRTDGFKGMLERVKQRVFAAHRTGLGHPGSLGDLFQIGFARRKR